MVVVWVGPIIEVAKVKMRTGELSVEVGDVDMKDVRVLESDILDVLLDVVVDLLDVTVNDSEREIDFESEPDRWRVWVRVGEKDVLRVPEGVSDRALLILVLIVVVGLFEYDWVEVGLLVVVKERVALNSPLGDLLGVLLSDEDFEFVGEGVELRDSDMLVDFVREEVIVDVQLLDPELLNEPVLLWVWVFVGVLLTVPEIESGCLKALDPEMEPELEAVVLSNVAGDIDLVLEGEPVVHADELTLWLGVFVEVLLTERDAEDIRVLDSVPVRDGVFVAVGVGCIREVELLGDAVLVGIDTLDVVRVMVGEEDWVLDGL
jgi:hypothetical protein